MTMRTAVTGLLVSLLAVSAAQAKPDFHAQARCIAAYEVAAGLLEADADAATGADKVAIRKRIAKLDTSREKLSLALATRTDLTPADSKASQQDRKAEEARLDKLAPAAVQAIADACDQVSAAS
jgi:Skp family chaperone for outer membrane proteins